VTAAVTRITLEEAADPEAQEAVWSGLRAYNELHSGPGSFDSRPLRVVLRDEAGAPLGGLIGRSYAGWLYVELFHIPEAHRRAGMGRKILAMAEREAAERGCIGVRLETMSFQAPGFYARLGYSVVGTLRDFPPGHTRFTLAKRLDGAPLEVSACST
jgi:GNAT superfamily N-acetyltransferase